MTRKRPEDVDVTALAAEIRSHFTKDEWFKAIDVMAQIHAIHLKYIGCEDKDCVVTRSLDSVGTFATELGELCWPGTMQTELKKMGKELFAAQTIEELVEKIKAFPMPDDKREQIIEAAKRLHAEKTEGSAMMSTSAVVTTVPARGEREAEAGIDPTGDLRKNLEQRILKAVKDAGKKPVEGPMPFPFPPSTKVH